MAANGMEASFMDIFGEFLEGYTNCAIKAGTTPEQFQFSIGTLIKARGKKGWLGDMWRGGQKGAFAIPVVRHRLRRSSPSNSPGLDGFGSV